MSHKFWVTLYNIRYILTTPRSYSRVYPCGRRIQGEIPENSDKILENRDKILENRDKILENRDKIPENSDKILENRDRKQKQNPSKQ